MCIISVADTCEVRTSYYKLTDSDELLSPNRIGLQINHCVAGVGQLICHVQAE
jgi:hypothetical protein